VLADVQVRPHAQSPRRRPTLSRSNVQQRTT
jgi:hypothetical protein